MSQIELAGRALGDGLGARFHERERLGVRHGLGRDEPADRGREA